MFKVKGEKMIIILTTAGYIINNSILIGYEEK